MYSFTFHERELFRSLLMDHFGLEFEEHRHNVLDGAISGRMEVCKIDSAAAYRRVLENNGAELDMLVDSVTNNLSRFFRNADQLRAITNFVVPELDADECGGARPRGQRDLSVWVAGCATGEEPYSLAMVLTDNLPESRGFHITATDISNRALDIARAGVYATTRTRGVPNSIRTRHFVDDGRRLAISELLRRRVSFVQHNLIESPLVHDADIILCRNVLTYLAASARQSAVRRLRESISDGGFLLIGNSETLPRRSGFDSIVTAWARLYRRPCPAGE